MKHILFRRVFLIIICGIFLLPICIICEEEKTSECPLIAIIPASGGKAEQIQTTGKIFIYTPPNPGEKPFPFIEATFPRGAKFIKVFPSSLPDFARILIPEDRNYYYFVNPNQQDSNPTSFYRFLELREPSPLPQGRNLFLYSYLKILDANGKPAEGFHADLCSSSYYPDKRTEYIPLDSAILDDTGILRFHYPQTCSGSIEFEREKTTFAIGYFLRIKHPETDQEQILPVPHMISINGILEPSDTLYLSMTAPDQDNNEEMDATYRSRVIDYEGQPVSGALAMVSSFWIGTETFNLPVCQYHYTTKDGILQITLPRDLIEECTGSTTIPSHAFIHPRIDPPEECRQIMCSTSQKLTTDKETTIILPRYESVVFIFLDENNLPLGDDKIKNGRGIRLIKGDNYNPDAQYYSQKEMLIKRYIRGEGMVEVGPVPLPETYYVLLDENLYGPMQLKEEDRSSPIICGNSIPLVMRERRNFTGRVIDAITSAPIQGACVFLTSQEIGGYEKDKKLWEGIPEDGILHDISDMKDPSRPNPVLNNIIAIGKTDSGGRYRFSHEDRIEKYASGWVLNIEAPGKARIRQTALGLEKYWIRGKDIILLPDAPLLPAAYLKGKILPPYILPDPYLRENVMRSMTIYSFNFGFSDVQIPRTWALYPSATYSTRKPVWRMSAFGAHFPINSDFTFEIPADIVFSLYASMPWEPVIRKISWENLGPVKPGEVLEIPPREAELNSPYIIKVLYPDRKPAVGITVRIRGAKPLVTDENGSVIGWSTGTCNRVQLNNWEKGNEIMKKVKITVPEDDNKIPIVEIILDKDKKEILLGSGFLLW
jgi:hypothetical protein